jgi:glucokinase
MRDYTAVLPEGEGVAIQLCHAKKPCSINTRPLQFTLVHNNGIHPSRIRYCLCSDIDRSSQLLRVNLFPATPEQPETAFTFAALATFRMHNLQSKVTAFDWMTSLRWMTEEVSSPKVAVSEAVWNQ